MDNSKAKKAFSGFDIVSYHQFEKPRKGSKNITFVYQGLKFQFISQRNMKLFKYEPDKYLPQYDGNCAYGIAFNGKKYRVNPKSYEIYDGKLYLFYKRSFIDYQRKWLNNGADSLRIKADENWIKRIND